MTIKNNCCFNWVWGQESVFAFFILVFVLNYQNMFNLFDTFFKIYLFIVFYVFFSIKEKNLCAFGIKFFTISCMFFLVLLLFFTERKFHIFFPLCSCFLTVINIGQKLKTLDH